ncbi:hypothetical protein COLO4_25037 [Corchorus olitorius]|uniref:Uncharacterized protein n=1 Tax=Corchorus olitorius TaxID=93759 RepID=A0A1R3I516_9ROSI|nr:hypothetical protein COLO4_25037 [Corchorus olitorius]
MDKEKSVNAVPNYGHMKTVEHNVKKAIVPVKQHKDNPQDFQDDNTGIMEKIQPILLQQGEGSKNRDSHEALMETDFNKMGSEEVKSKSNNNEVVFSDKNGRGASKLCQFNRQPSSHKFDNYWTRHEEFRKVVVDSWGSNHASSLQEVTSKIRNCSLEFVHWNKSIYGSLGLKIAKVRQELST